MLCITVLDFNNWFRKAIDIRLGGNNGTQSRLISIACWFVWKYMYNTKQEIWFVCQCNTHHQCDNSSGSVETWSDTCRYCIRIRIVAWTSTETRFGLLEVFCRLAKWIIWKWDTNQCSNRIWKCNAALYTFFLGMINQTVDMYVKSTWQVPTSSTDIADSNLSATGMNY